MMGKISRRRLLAGSAALALVGFRARRVEATPAEAAAFITKLTGGAAPKDGKVTLTIPEVAENGASVRITASVTSPMTEKDYVKAIHIVAEDNPLPGVASYTFTPAAGKAEITMLMRLGKTQKVHAVAVMSDGSAWQSVKECKVTVGGC